ncbi:MAG: anti-sigma F factor [Oscillospiraceae bacterium]|nr:anti-sigma F factor [Oscillospiraceae bacterium]
MEVLNQMKISFLSKSENESFSRAAVSSFIAQLDPRIDELGDIRTAVSEAVTNAIVHAYRTKPGVVTVSVKITDKRCVYIQINDRGCGIEDVEKAKEPLFTTAANEERAGLGFAVMESFMDKLTVRSRVGYGTSVSMMKKLADNETEDK